MRVELMETIFFASKIFGLNRPVDGGDILRIVGCGWNVNCYWTVVGNKGLFEFWLAVYVAEMKEKKERSGQKERRSIII